jgi:HAD superfamily hydrolase (TIGR01509 family)
LEAHNITPPKDLREKLVTLSIMQSAEYLKENFPLPLSVEEIIDLITAKAEENYKFKITLKPYVKEYLEKLKGQRVRMAVATANDDQITREILNRLGILDYFEFIITCNEVGCSKEEPKIYQLAAEKFGCAPKDLVVFEDAFHCIKTAKNAGFYVVGVADKNS